MEDKIKICFDKEYKIRVMDPVKFERSEELDVECSAFMESKCSSSSSSSGSSSKHSFVRSFTSDTALCCAVLCCSVLCCSVLCCVVFCCVVV
jgi:hypothetical protein